MEICFLKLIYCVFLLISTLYFIKAEENRKTGKPTWGTPLASRIRVPLEYLFFLSTSIICLSWVMLAMVEGNRSINYFCFKLDQEQGYNFDYSPKGETSETFDIPFKG